MSEGEAGSGETLKALLPAQVQSRVQTVLVKNGAATLVVDVAGLDSIERERTEAAIREALAGAPGITEVRIAMTADKPARQIIAVGSGKGGVGKSTLSANLAIALSRLGRKVGLVDADIYGPSQTRLMATEGIRPTAHDSKMNPVRSPHGISVLSMGNLIEPDKAIAWRGPMASGALGQLIDADWGDAEILVVDLPPGTGDVQLTMLQKHKPVGAVIVSTPQDLALIDATRAMQLFNQAGVPIIGMVENMAGYVCPDCGGVSNPFGSGGAEDCAAKLGEAFLGRIPLTLTIRQESDAGRPPALGDGPEAQAFMAIARRVSTWLDNQ